MVVLRSVKSPKRDYDYCMLNESRENFLGDGSLWEMYSGSEFS